MDGLGSKQAILFDMIDTLVHYDGPPPPEYGGQVALTFESALGDRGPGELKRFLGTWEEVRRARYREARATLREIDLVGRVRETLDRMGPTYAAEGNVKAFLEPYLSAYVDCLLLPATTPATLARLRERFRLAVVTNWQHSPTMYQILDHFELMGHFDAVVVSGEFGWRKPHPAIFQEALKRLDVTPQGTVFVGDDPEADIKGAAACGMDAILLDWKGLHQSHTGPRVTGLWEVADVLGVWE
jgi:putative hydrolase of the HAD superfamily